MAIYSNAYFMKGNIVVFYDKGLMMNIGVRLEAIGNLVPQGCTLADVGTDHAYLPVWLLQKNRITHAVAGDIAEGPCRAARSTVAMYGVKDKVEVRLGSGLKVLQPGEVECVTIAGMGASTMIDIFEEAEAVTASLKHLVLQPMAGAASLRRWLCEHGWVIVDEDLVEDGVHFYEIISAVPGEKSQYSDAEYLIGPVLLKKGHLLLEKHFQRQCNGLRQLMANMERSQQAMASEKYVHTKELLLETEALYKSVLNKA